MKPRDGLAHRDTKKTMPSPYTSAHTLSMVRRGGPEAECQSSWYEDTPV